MAIIASINGTTRRVHLDPAQAVNGTLTFHPVIDVYRDYKAMRQNDETIRPFDSFMEAAGNIPKGGGKFTPRYLTLLQGAKLVIPAGITQVNVTGEVITDDQTPVFDTSLVVGPCIINYAPSEAEVIQVAGGGGTGGDGITQQQVRDAVWGASLTGYLNPSTFGGFVQRLLTVVKFLALK